MLARLITAAAFGAALVCAAQAQSSSSSTQSHPSAMTPPNSAASSNQQSTQSIPQEIRQKLSQDGFTNIQIVPGSFLVSAKDKRGDPVTMVIGPNSMMMFSEVPTSNGKSTTGSSSSSSSSGVGSNSTSK
jgi:hypothetical protein